MKYRNPLKCIVVTICLFYCFVTNAQNDTGKNGLGLIIKASFGGNPLTICDDWENSGHVPYHDFFLGGALEYFITPYISIQLNEFYQKYSYTVVGFDQPPIYSTSDITGLQGKYFLGSKLPQGIYIGVFTLFENSKKSQSDLIEGWYSNTTAYYLGPIAGVQYYIFKCIDVDFMVTMGGVFTNSTENLWGLSPECLAPPKYNDGLFFRCLVGLEVGYKF